MIGQDPERLVIRYVAGVHHPEVSGMEHLNLLQIRSHLADSADELSEAQRGRVRKADQVLFARANDFLDAIQKIADLESWRAQEDVIPTHWWWYLDVIVNLPAQVTSETKQESILETTVG